MSKRSLAQLFNKQTPAEIFQSGETQRFQSRLASAKGGQTKFAFLWAGGVCLALSLYYGQFKAAKAQQEIEYRKERLAQPITHLTTESGTELPWSSKTVKEWLYKPVQITGRPIHSKTVMIPSRSEGLDGFQYVVPLCTKETDDGIPIEGVFLNKGFIPHEYAHAALRFKIEDSFHQQTFTGYVSQLDDYKEHGLFTPGNSPDIARNKWNYADLKEMGNIHPFQNKDAVRAAVIESCNLDTPLNERSAQITDISCDYREDYPYRKTLSGALTQPNMPWDYKNKGSNYFCAGLASTVIGLTLFI